MKSFEKQKRFIEVNNIAGIITEKLSHKFRQSTMEFYPMTKEKKIRCTAVCANMDNGHMMRVFFFPKISQIIGWIVQMGQKNRGYVFSVELKCGDLKNWQNYIQGF